MIIQQKRIRNIHKHLKQIPPGQSIIFGVSGLERFTEKNQTVGFTPSMLLGESVLPPGIFGPISQFNAEGKYHIHRDQPQETAHRMAEWHWTEWRGRYDTRDMSKIVDIPYKRYPRTFVSPPSVELTLVESADEGSLIIGPLLAYSEDNAPLLTHIANLLLEIFGECQVFTEQLESFITVPIRRLNWNVLPTGKRPWEKLYPEIKSLIEQEPEGNQPVIKNRFAKVNSYGPDFVAVGQAGFQGYIVFGFPDRTLFILESTQTNNATYVFNENWERLSQMTKAEILNNDLQTDRIIHRKSWYQRMSMLLNGTNGTQSTLISNISD